VRAKCVSTTINDVQRQELALKPYQQMDVRGYLTIGKEYPVLGLEFEVDPQGFESGVYIWIVPDVGYLVRFRTVYFEISDPPVSSQWQIQLHHAGNVTLWPPLFYRDDYLETYCRQDEYDQDDIRAVLDAFEEVIRQLTTEAESR